LWALGYPTEPDEDGHFGLNTEAAVKQFQSNSGLHPDGACGWRTWSALVEAGRTLGERLLYYRRELLRGDDVASMQRQLGALGFDAGRPDGIFGPETHAALSDFQRNVGLREDGICGPSTVQALSRYTAKITGRVLVAGVRERMRLSEAPRTLRGWHVAVGETGGLAAAVQATRRVLARSGADVLTVHNPDEVAQADEANAAKVDIYLGLGLDTDLDGCRTSYFLGHDGFYSEAGRHLAGLAHDVVTGQLGLAPRGCRGTRRTILRHTRMPAVVVDLGPASVLVLRGAELADALEAALSQWVAHPIPDD
jgi:N-acetylmuramoyl-L-alanine amidase